MTPRFAAGDAVRIVAREHPGHHRTPAYVRGRAATVERYCGAFPNPERLAYGGDAPPADLYRVRMPQRALWPDYAGPAGDVLEIEIYGHWLEPLAVGEP